MAVKLFIVEGLPGSGKSTAANIVYELLIENGVDAELFCEGNYNHPADFDGAAFFTSQELESLEQSYPAHKNILEKIKFQFADGYVIPYIKAMKERRISAEDEIFDVIAKNDIYELPLEQHKKLLLNRWSNFAATYSAKAVVFECCFIQNPVTVSMIRDNASKDITMEYISRLAEIIKPLKPVLIYIDQKDIKSSFKRVIPERSREWLEGFTQYYTNQGYGLVHGLKGQDGVLEVLEARNEFEKEIYASLDMVKYKIDNSDLKLDLLKDEIHSIVASNI